MSVKLSHSVGSSGEIWIGVKLNGYEDIIWFANTQAPNKTWANLINDSMLKALVKKIEKDRRKFYEMGWEDKQKRNKKKTEFSGCFNDESDKGGAW